MDASGGGGVIEDVASASAAHSCMMVAARYC